MAADHVGAQESQRVAKELQRKLLAAERGTSGVVVEPSDMTETLGSMSEDRVSPEAQRALLEAQVMSQTTATPMDPMRACCPNGSLM